MKQRVKMAQCIFSDTAIVLLDEPCTNLDTEGIELYHRLIDDYCKDRLVVVSSNDEVEYKILHPETIYIRIINEIALSPYRAMNVESTYEIIKT